MCSNNTAWVLLSGLSLEEPKRHTRKDVRIKVAYPAIEKLKATIHELTRRTRGHRLMDIVQELKTALTGWKNYFGIAEVLIPLREIDKMAATAVTMLRMETMGQRGLPRYFSKRRVSLREAWNTSNSAHGPGQHEINRHARNRRLREPYVRWCGRRCRAASCYPDSTHGTNDASKLL